MKCVKCGAELEPGATYCPYCSSNFDSELSERMYSNSIHGNGNIKKSNPNTDIPTIPKTSINQNEITSFPKKIQSNTIIVAILVVVIFILCIALFNEKGNDDVPTVYDENSQISDSNYNSNQINEEGSNHNGEIYLGERTETLNTLIEYLNTSSIAKITEKSKIFEYDIINDMDIQFYEFRTGEETNSNLIGIYGISNDEKYIYEYSIEEDIILPLNKEQDSELNKQVSLGGYSYGIGKYKLLYSIKIRKGPDVEYDRLIKSDLPSEFYNSSNQNGGLNPDTVIEVSEVTVTGNRVWGKISCGWICLYDEKTLVESVE